MKRLILGMICLLASNSACAMEDKVLEEKRTRYESDDDIEVSSSRLLKQQKVEQSLPEADLLMEEDNSPLEEKRARDENDEEECKEDPNPQVIKHRKLEKASQKRERGEGFDGLPEDQKKTKNRSLGDGNGKEELKEEAEKAKKKFHITLEEINSLITQGGINELNKDEVSPLHRAAICGNIEGLMLLFGSEDINLELQGKNGCTPLHVAAQFGQIECLQFLLDAKADREISNSQGLQPLHVAAEFGQLECLEALLRAGANREAQDNNGMTPLYVAAWKGQLGCLEALLRAEANREAQAKNGMTPLYVAAQCGQLGCLEALLRAEANIEAQTNNGLTPLHVAAKFGKLECLKALLEAGANIETQTKNGLTPLHVAAWKGQLACLEALLRAGANREAQDKNGWTPLHAAAGNGKLECLEALLRAGANKEAQDKNGLTPLHTAAGAGKLECLEALLRAGADMCMTNNAGRTPFEEAVKCGSWNIVDAHYAEISDDETLDEKVNLQIEGQLFEVPLEFIKASKSLSGMVEDVDISMPIPLLISLKQWNVIHEHMDTILRDYRLRCIGGEAYTKSDYYKNLKGTLPQDWSLLDNDQLRDLYERVNFLDIPYLIEVVTEAMQMKVACYANALFNGVVPEALRKPYVGGIIKLLENTLNNDTE